MKRIPIADLGRNVLQLPRLRIPSLAATADRYRASVLALTAGESDEKHLGKLGTFLTTSAPVLQKHIVDKDKAAAESGAFPFSYVEELLQSRMLSSRVPLEVNCNTAFVLDKKIEGTDGTQAGVAAGVIHSIAEVIADARTKGVPVPSLGAEGRATSTGSLLPEEAGLAFDLSPLATEFGRSLVPMKDKDSVVVTPLEKLRHVIVLHDAHVYVVQVFDEATGAVVDRALLQKALEVILTVTPDHDNSSPVTVLTAGNRTVWAQAYQELIKTPENAAELQRIQEGVIVVCLDSKGWGDSQSVAEAAALHGSKEEMENRWYDKHQMIVSADGQVVFNFEPTFSQRVHWAYWIDAVLARLAKSASDATNAAAAVSARAHTMEPAAVTAITHHVRITYGKSFAAHIRTARQEATALVTDTELHSVVLPYGREQFAAMKITPHAFVQLTLNVARYLVHERLCATAELCSTTGFFHGSTELVRSATPESLLVAEKIAAVHKEMAAATASSAKAASTPAAAAKVAAAVAPQPGTSSETIAELEKIIRAAAHTHDRLSVEAVHGEGVDRHLAALHSVAVLNGDKAALAFFEDPVYVRSSTFLLNTCEFSRPWLRNYVIGPAVTNGYGLGYVIGERETRLSLSAFTNSPATNVADMTASTIAAAESIARCLSGQKM